MAKEDIYYKNKIFIKKRKFMVFNTLVILIQNILNHPLFLIHLDGKIKILNYPTRHLELENIIVAERILQTNGFFYF